MSKAKTAIAKGKSEFGLGRRVCKGAIGIGIAVAIGFD